MKKEFDVKEIILTLRNHTWQLKLIKQKFKIENDDIFKKQNSGRIINIASRAAFRGDTPEYLAYAASKAGMVALTKSIARGFGKEGITAFSIAPGFTRTAMAQKSIDKYGEDFVIKDISLNKLTEPKDIAPIVVLICSGKFDHGTGSCIDMNAGSYVR